MQNTEDHNGQLVFSGDRPASHCSLSMQWLDNISYLIHCSPHTLCYCAQVGWHVREGRITLSGCLNNSATQNKAAGCVRKRNRKSSTWFFFWFFSFLVNLTLNKWPELVIQKRWKDKWRSLQQMPIAEKVKMRWKWKNVGRSMKVQLSQ